jgi:hypothetical protein
MKINILKYFKSDYSCIILDKRKREKRCKLLVTSDENRNITTDVADKKKIIM